jgi:pectate lyase
MKKMLLLGAFAIISAGASAASVELGRQTLSAADGWAAAEGGTTGGAAAKPENVYTVSSRKEFVQALKQAGDAPKIVYVRGTIDLSSDDNGRELTEEDYAAPGYSFAAYIAAYNPNIWNRQPLVKGKPPELTGALEEARVQSSKNQRKQIEIPVPSNTTIVGYGSQARIIHGNLLLGKNTSNVIIRNITFEDAFDFFPAWEPGDSYSAKSGRDVISNGVNYSVPGCQEKFENDLKGPHRCNGGRWNAEYDLISINGASHVWIDHCSFTDGENPDSKFSPVYDFPPYNQPEMHVQHHDGLVDITNGANFITVSFNRFHEHDKTMLIGGSDNKQAVDSNKLKVTLHHNYYEHAKQRQPRVRFGQVHVYNNYYAGDPTATEYPFSYSVGLGKLAQVVFENNYFELAENIRPDAVIGLFNADSSMTERGTMINGKPVEVIGSFNANNADKKVPAVSGWVPQYVYRMMQTKDVPSYVFDNAGAGRL